MCVVNLILSSYLEKISRCESPSSFGNCIFYISLLKLKNNNNKIQYSVPSIAEIDMTSSGSGYERHLTTTLTMISEEKQTKI